MSISNRSTAICVLGMHRSGTSSVTRGLNLAGAYLGKEDDLVPGNYENSEGFWEHTKIIDIHDKILEFYSSAWHTLAPLPPMWWKSPDVVPFKEELKSLIIREFISHDLWAWKDPRTCLLLPLWLDVLEELNVELRVVVVLRNPFDVANSLSKRDLFTKEESYAMWKLNTLTYLYHAENTKKVVIEYNEYIENPMSILQQTWNGLDLQWVVDEELLSNRLADFIKPSLRHSKTGYDNDNMPILIKEVCNLLRKASVDISYADEIEFKERINSLYDEYIEYSKILAPSRKIHNRFKIQIYYPNSGAYTEQNSLTLAGRADGQFREYLIPISAAANGAIRFDATDTPSFIEIENIKLMQIDSKHVFYEWSNKNSFEGISFKENTLLLNRNSNCLKLLSLNCDPQLILDGYGEIKVPSIIRIRMRSEKLHASMIESIVHLTETLQTNIRYLNERIENNQVEKQNMEQKNRSLHTQVEELNLALIGKQNLEQEIELLNNRVKDLEIELIDKRNMERDIRLLSKRNEDLRAEVATKEVAYNQQIEENERLFDNINHKDSELALIKNSHGYRFLLHYYLLRDKLLPINSRRRKAMKLTFALLTNPKRTKGLLTKSNFKKIMHHLKRGNYTALLSKMESKVTSEVNSFHSEPSFDGTNYFLRSLKKENRSIFTDIMPTVDIIIPIYNAYDYTKKCIEKVYENTDITYNLYLINDCSPDPRVKELLDSLDGKKKPSQMQNLVIIHNEENLGFVRNVNKGMAISRNHVILLNTDTEVPKNWVSRLIMPILGDYTIASVTPFSNSATTCSFPNFCEDNELPENLSVDELDQLFEKYGSNIPIELPSAVGFCMAINRGVLDKIGLFDADAFGKGYGEENDWCLRAYQAGFSNVLAPNLLVYHKHGVSFGQRTDKKREERMEENLKIIDQRYPDYIPWVHRFIAQDPIKPVRNVVITSMISRNDSHKEGVMFINHSLGGGSKFYQDQYIEQVLNQKRVYVLELRGNEYVIIDKNYKQEIIYSLPRNEINDVIFNELLQLMNIQHIFINQLVTYPLFEIMDYIQYSEAKYTFFIHDYFAVCPSYFLLDGDGNHCFAETDLEKCAKCIKKNLITEPWINMSADSINIQQWRSRFHLFLKQASQVIAPSNSTKDIVNRYYPDLQIDVQEHILTTPVQYTYRPEFIHQDELCIAFVGALGEYKGANIVYELKEEVKRNGLPIKIIVIGVTNRHHDYYVSEDGILEVTGRYDNKQISYLLEKHRISIVVIPSLCPETYSYTTSESIYSGYPIITFNLGAPAERVIRYDAGWVVNEMTAGGIYSLLEHLYYTRGEIEKKVKNIASNVRERVSILN